MNYMASMVSVCVKHRSNYYNLRMFLFSVTFSKLSHTIPVALSAIEVVVTVHWRRLWYRGLCNSYCYL